MEPRPREQNGKALMTLVPLQDPVRPGDTGAAPTSATVGWDCVAIHRGTCEKRCGAGLPARLFTSSTSL